MEKMTVNISVTKQVDVVNSFFDNGKLGEYLQCVCLNYEQLVYALVDTRTHQVIVQFQNVMKVSRGYVLCYGKIMRCITCFTTLLDHEETDYRLSPPFSKIVLDTNYHLLVLDCENEHKFIEYANASELKSWRQTWGDRSHVVVDKEDNHLIIKKNFTFSKEYKVILPYDTEKSDWPECFNQNYCMVCYVNDEEKWIWRFLRLIDMLEYDIPFVEYQFVKLSDGQHVLKDYILITNEQRKVSLVSMKDLRGTEFYDSIDCSQVDKGYAMLCKGKELAGVVKLKPFQILEFQL